jgi:formylglycine-generating enzyme required for sulfatase activity
MTFRKIEPGDFLMGSPAGEYGRYEDESQHSVRIMRPFWMGVHPVTQEQYQAVMGCNPSFFQGQTKCPVERVSWNAGVKGFCERLAGATKLNVRLPTEAEWEYACRAETSSPFNTGTTIGTDKANYNGNGTYGNGAVGYYRQATTPVDNFVANTLDLHDMHGNVWEWCKDWYGKDYYTQADNAVDPEGPTSGRFRVLRGGSWQVYPRDCRSAARSRARPDYRSSRIGFRVVLEQHS